MALTRTRLAFTRWQLYLRITRNVWVFGGEIQDERTNSFVAAHPYFFWFWRKYSRAYGWWIELIDHPRRRWRALRDRIGEGPVKVHVNTLDCMNWYDSDDLILHTSFQILTDFIEKEVPSLNLDSDHKHGTRNLELARKVVADRREPWLNEILFLYDWWHQVYIPQRDEALHINNEEALAITRGEHYEGEAYSRLMGHRYLFKLREEDEMLVRLIRHRHKMWV